MNRIGVPESEHKELVAYLKKTYKYEDGGIVNRKTGRRPKDKRMANGYLNMSFSFNGKHHSTKLHRIVWTLCHDQLPTLTIDHINGDRLDNRIENLREVSMSENRLNMLLPWVADNASGVAGVEKAGHKYRTRIHGRRLTFLNPYEAFYWAIVCGKRYKPTPSPSQKGGELSRARKQ